jgi:hypothetical protein
MVLSAFAFVAGAIMYWALTSQSTSAAQNHGFRLSTVGVILMIAGGVGFVASAAVFASSRRSASSPSRTMDRQATDSEGHSTAVHEEQH